MSCNTNGVTTNGHSRSRQAPVQKHMARQGLMQHDSGNEESDSLHSLYHCNHYYIIIYDVIEKELILIISYYFLKLSQRMSCAEMIHPSTVWNESCWVTD